MTLRIRECAMASFYARLCNWTRRTTKPFGKLLFDPSQGKAGKPDAGGGLIYRLRHWPLLPDAYKTADVYRMLSVMSNRLVNRSWIQAHSKLPAEQLDRLLQRLVDKGAVDVIDASKFMPAAKHGG